MSRNHEIIFIEQVIIAKSAMLINSQCNNKRSPKRKLESDLNQELEDSNLNRNKLIFGMKGISFYFHF